jgi:hypothetical protein
VPLKVRLSTDLLAAPPAALWPGLAGLLPFIAGSLGGWVLPEAAAAWASGALVGYGAVILTFVGAIHWGLALGLVHARDTDAGAPSILFGYAWSVVPALLGWAALLLPRSGGLLLLIVGFGLQLFIDARLAAVHRLPAWYLGLRLLLTTVVITCLVVALPA